MRYPPYTRWDGIGCYKCKNQFCSGDCPEPLHFTNTDNPVDLPYPNVFEELAEKAWDQTAVSPEFGHPVSFAKTLYELILEEYTVYLENLIDHRVPASEYPRLIKEYFRVK